MWARRQAQIRRLFSRLWVESAAVCIHPKVVERLGKRHITKKVVAPSEGHWRLQSRWREPMAKHSDGILCLRLIKAVHNILPAWLKIFIMWSFFHTNQWLPPPTNLAQSSLQSSSFGLLSEDDRLFLQRLLNANIIYTHNSEWCLLEANHWRNRFFFSNKNQFSFFFSDPQPLW